MRLFDEPNPNGVGDNGGIVTLLPTVWLVPPVPWFAILGWLFGEANGIWTAEWEGVDGVEEDGEWGSVTHILETS